MDSNNDEETDQTRSYFTTTQSSDELFGGHNQVSTNETMQDLGLSTPQGYLNTQLDSYSSATSWDYGHQPDSGLFNTESAQSTICPETRESDLDGIDPRFNLPEAAIPQNLDSDFHPGSRNVSVQPPWFSTSPQTTLNRTMMGVPQQPPSTLHPSEHQLNQINTTYWALVSGQECSDGDISKAAESTTGALHDFFISKLAAKQHLSNDSEEKDKNKNKDRECYQCLVCDVQKKKKITFPTFGSLKRHLSTMHGFRDSMYRCLNCDPHRIFYRRDRAREHLFYTHKQVDLQPADVDATRISMPSPPNCPICSETVQSWEEFFRHIKKHCLMRSGSVGGSTNGGRSRHGDNGHGNGRGNDGNGNGPSFAGPSSGNGQHPSYHGTWSSNQANGQHGNYLGPGPFPGNFMSRSKVNSRPGPIMRSVSDDQLNISYHLGAKNDTEEFSMDDVFDAPFDSNFHVAGGISQQPNHSRPPRNLGLPQVDPSSQKRKRPIKPKESTKQKFLSPRKCMRCDHDLGKCQRCAHFTESVRSCHKCTDAPGDAVQTGSSSKMLPQTRQDFSSTIVTLNQSHLGMAMGGFELYPNMLGPSTNHQYNGTVQHLETQTQPNSFYNYDSTDQLFDDTSPTDSFIGVAMVVEDHRPLSGVQSKIQESPVFDCDLGLLQSIGLGSLIEPCSPKSQVKQTKKKVPIGPAPGSYTDLVFRKAESSPKPQAPEPVPQCQCPCVTMPTVKYEALASAQLSPSERVEMTFKMLPAARETSHPLRTRVQVFVKLFRLRSSITKPPARKKQRDQSITSETNPGADVESDTDPDHEISPTSPSGLEIAPISFWTEDVQDWSFEFDVKWALTKLAQWTSGITADTCSKLFLSDPSHILDLISMYIIYKFKICWWLLSRDGLNLFLSI
jgi:hypothetical protein